MKEEKGITLVALVITIIVMLILVGVSITIALKGGLFDRTREAANSYKDAHASEERLDFITYTDEETGTTYSGLEAINAVSTH